MVRTTARLMASASVLLVIAACSESPEAVRSPVDATSPPEMTHAGVIRTWGGVAFPSELAPYAERAVRTATTSKTGIFYHGGPLLINATNVAAVYWAGSTIYSGGPTPGTHGSGSQDGSLVGYFLNHLGGSGYFNINTTYYDGTGASVKNVVNYTQYWANNTNAPSGTQSVTDAQMVSMLQSGFTSGALTYDPNTLYAIFTAGKVNLGGGFGTQYCAYHSWGSVTVNGTSRTVLYAAMPYDYAYPTGCTNGTAAPNGDPGADAEVNTLAHETEETTTDERGNAWYDRRGYENADKCAWNFGTTQTNGTGVWNITVGTKQFLVQQNWINSGSGGCRLSF